MSFVVTKTEITLGFEKDKPTRYKLAQQTIPPVTFKPVFSVKTQQTREAVGVDNMKTKKIRFYPGKRFKNVLEDMKFVSISGSIGGGGESEDNKPSGGGGGADFE